MAATVTRNPTSDENVVGTWSGSAGTRYTLVDDYPDTGGTDVLTTSATGGGQITFGFSAFSLPSVATSITVFVDYYDRKSASQSCNIGARLKIGGSYFNAATHNPANGVITQRTDTFSTNPATSSAWTAADVNGIQAFGVNSTDSSPSIDVTSIQIRVTYTGDYPLNAEPGSFALAVSDMSFLWQHILAANPYGFTLAGAPATLKYNTDATDFPGLVAWHDASQETGYNDGDVATIANDFSGNSRTLRNSNSPHYKANIQNGKAVFRYSDTTSDTHIRITGENSLTTQWQNVGYGVVAFVFKSNKGATTKGDVVFIETGTGVGRFGMAVSETGLTGQFTLFGRRLDGDSAQFLSGGTVVNGQWNICIIRVEWANAKAWLYQNGNLLNSTTAFQTAGNTSNTESFSVDIASSNGASWMDGDVGEAAWYNAQWTDQNVTDMFTYLNRKWNVYSTTTNYVLSADPAGFTLTGAVSSTLAARALSLDPATYTLAGQAATLSHGYVFSADPASYALAGQPTNFLWTHVLSADPSSYAISSPAAGTLYGRIFSADPAAFALSGAVATLSHGYVMQALAGAFGLSPPDAALLATRLLSLDPTSYALAGQAATLSHGYVLPANPASFTLTGADIATLRTYVLQALAGSITLSGQAAATLKGYMLNAAAGSLGLAGADSTDLAARLLQAIAGAYALAGADANLIYSGGGPQNYVLSADAGSFILTGFAASVTATRQMNAQPAAYSLTEPDIAALFGHLLNAQPTTFLLSGAPAGTLAARVLNANPAAFTLTGQPATTLRTYVLLALPGAFALVGLDATLNYAGAVSEGRATSANIRVYLVIPTNAAVANSSAGNAPETKVKGSDSL